MSHSNLALPVLLPPTPTPACTRVGDETPINRTTIHLRFLLLEAVPSTRDLTDSSSKLSRSVFTVCRAKMQKLVLGKVRERAKVPQLLSSAARISA